MKCLQFFCSQQLWLYGFVSIMGSNLTFAKDQLPTTSWSPISGSEFIHLSSNNTYSEREKLILSTFLSGSFPSHLLDFKPVVLSHGQDKLVIMVSPDYLAIGSDDDFVRMPMALDTGLQIARQLDCILPTRRIVDAIYEQAKIKVEAYYLPPGSTMGSNSYFQKHHEWIQNQFLDHFAYGQLVAGHKKDVVLTHRLLDRTNRVAIYGWPRIRDRSPTQPLSTWHSRSYVDYSHGIRLVSRTAWLNNTKVDLHEVFNEPNLSHLVSDEGSFDLNAIMNANWQRATITAH